MSDVTHQPIRDKALLEALHRYVHKLLDQRQVPEDPGPKLEALERRLQKLAELKFVSPDELKSAITELVEKLKPV